MERASLALLLALLLTAAVVGARGTTVAYNDRALVIDGQRRIIIFGSIHYPRSTPEMWPDLIRKSKEGGLDAIETYVFWNGHEPRPRQYNFEGNYDIVRFFKEIQNASMYAILRIGPYICGEWNYGGLPAWLRDIPGMQFRMHNEPFEREMEIFTTLIVNKLKEANMFAGQGGPIILSQIENEYGNIMTNLKDAQSALQYIHWCADMANKQNVGVPWIMCQQDADVPSNVELASTIAKLEESKHKLAALKAQRDNTQGTPILFPTLRNKNASEDKVRDKQRELQDLEVTRKELTELASKRLVEIKRLHEERIKLLNKLTIFQDTLTDFKNIRSSKAFQPVNDQLQKSHAELDHYQTLLEKL